VLYTRRILAMTVPLPTTWVDFLLDVFVYSLVSRYSLFMYGSNFIEIFIVMGA
jgi:hypothetical protein